MSAVVGTRREEQRDTQLDTIRDLMLAAGQRGAWLTLGEIAGLTEIGEASISAQLRHLRKRRHGRHVVEKRRRVVHGSPGALEAGEGNEGRAGNVSEPVRWEYRVWPPSAG